jgi:pantothenate kinase type III
MNNDPLIIALNDFSLDKKMFDKMSRKDLKIFVDNIITPNSGKHMIVSANYLLNLKIKNVKFENIIINKNIINKSRNNMKKIIIDYEIPMNAGIDSLFDSLVNKKNINSFI